LETSVSVEQQIAFSAAMSDWSAKIVPCCLGAIRESRSFLVAVATQVIASAIICGAARRPIFAGPADAYQTFFAAGAVFGPMVFAIVLFRHRQIIGDGLPQSQAYRLAWQALRSNTLTASYVANVAIVFAAAPIALSAFSAAKQAIPLIKPFSWDARIAALGAAMHGGAHLWSLLQPALAHPRITVAMDWFYHRFWSAALLGAFVFGTLLRPSQLRRQYLLSIVLLFLVVGTVAALAFASAGPAYYAQVVRASSNPYGPLLEYLRSVNDHNVLLSVRGEGVLWFAYTHRIEGFGYGVSAMPSVHVASATLTALFGFALSRVLGIVLSLVAAGTLVASVTLGWHYSLDGYVGAALAGVIWWFAGRVTRETH
jgi:hypothetical protein